MALLSHLEIENPLGRDQDPLAIHAEERLEIRVEATEKSVDPSRSRRRPLESPPGPHRVQSLDFLVPPNAFDTDEFYLARKQQLPNQEGSDIVVARRWTAASDPRDWQHGSEAVISVAF